MFSSDYFLSSLVEIMLIFTEMIPKNSRFLIIPWFFFTFSDSKVQD